MRLCLYYCHGAIATDDLIAYHNATISSVLRGHQRPTGDLTQVDIYIYIYLLFLFFLYLTLPSKVHIFKRNNT